jgi:tungstate transport system ATP-binding protein
MRLVLSNICQSFAGQTLFTIPQLTIESGVAVHLHGPNGSGKSTLMKIIAGLNKPTTGKVERIYDRAQVQQRPAVIYLHQQAYLFDKIHVK